MYPITLKKRRELRFLTIKLAKLRISYRWGFPFRLLIDYQKQIVTIKTVQQAFAFEAELNREEAEVEILNEQVNRENSHTRRDSVIYRLGTLQQQPVTERNNGENGEEHGEIKGVNSEYGRVQ